MHPVTKRRGREISHLAGRLIFPARSPRSAFPSPARVINKGERAKFAYFARRDRNMQACPVVEAGHRFRRVQDARVCTQLPRDRGLKQNGPVRGEKATTYVDISRLLDEAMGHFDQIPLSLNWGGRPDGFHLEPKAACKGNQPSRRAFRPDIFAIWTPRLRGS